MNILNTINTQNVLFRFASPYNTVDKSPLSDYIAFKSSRGMQNIQDPEFLQYEPFKYGYFFKFMFNFLEGVEHIENAIRENSIVEVLIPAAESNTYYRVGDKNGFKIVDFSKQFDLCPNMYTVTLQNTVPTKNIVEILNYANYKIYG